MPPFLLKGVHLIHTTRVEYSIWIHIHQIVEVLLTIPEDPSPVGKRKSIQVKTLQENKGQVQLCYYCSAAECCGRGTRVPDTLIPLVR